MPNVSQEALYQFRTIGKIAAAYSFCQLAWLPPSR